MKKLCFVILLVSAVSLLASCKKDGIIVPEVNNFNTLTVSVGDDDTKALFKDEGAGTVAWHKSDKLVVFDVKDSCRSLTHTEKTGFVNAIFTTSNWTGREPQYAVASKTEDHVFFNKGNLSVFLNDSQTIMAEKTFSSYAYISLGRVKKNNADTCSIKTMNQLAGFVKFKLSRNDVAYVVAESIGGEQICGWADIDTAKFALNVSDATKGKDFWKLTADSTKLTKLVITPTKDLDASLIFPAGDYYMMALPGTYSKGIRFTCLNSSKDTLSVSTVGASNGLTLKRGERTIITTPIDGNESFPSKVNINLDFTESCPFGTLEPTKSQSTAGETYDYSYSETIGGKTYSQTLNFTLFKGEGTYSYNSTSGYLGFTSNKNAIQLPAIPDRYLKSVTIKIENALDKKATIQTTKAYQSNPLKSFTVLASSSYTVNLTSNEATPGVGYWLRFTDNNFHIFKLELQYVRKLPSE